MAAALSGRGSTHIFRPPPIRADTFPMTDPLRAGVVGAGVFGGHHARKYASLPGVRLAAVLDPHEERSEALAGPLGGKIFDELEPFLEAVDVVTVAAPARAHARVAQAALERGKHVYVEKPLADDLADARRLVHTARDSDLVLACGHQERAIFRAIGLLDLPERPLRLESVRRGTPSDRNLDVSCVLDLMVHDIDLALALNPDPVAAVTAVGSRHAHGFADEARAELVFEGGMTAQLHASRAAERRERHMRLVFASGEVEIDFLTHRFRDTTGFGLDAAFASTSDGRDPLGASVAAFVAAVRGEAARPLVTGEEAARALEVALEVDRAAGRRRAIGLV